MKYPKEWEEVYQNLYRLKVPGGWIVIHRTHMIHKDIAIAHSESMVFVPDPDYEWKLEK